MPRMRRGSIEHLRRMYASESPLAGAGFHRGEHFFISITRRLCRGSREREKDRTRGNTGMGLLEHPPGPVGHALHNNGQQQQPPLVQRLGASFVPAEAWTVIRRTCREMPSERELQVLQGLAGHLSDQDMAAILGCKPRTVRAHREAVYLKLGCNDRSSAVVCIFKAALEALCPNAPPAR